MKLNVQLTSFQTGSNPVVDRGTWLAVTKSFLPVTRYIFGGSDEPYKFFHIDWLSAITDPFFLRWSATFTKTSLFPCKGKICVSWRLLYVYIHSFVCFIFYESSNKIIFFTTQMFIDQKYLQKEMLEFTDYAVQDMVNMMQKRRDPMAKRSGYNPNGSLSLSYDHPKEEDDTIKTANPTGGKTYEPSKQLKGEDITSKEPSLLYQKKQPQQAKFEYESCAASSERFTEELAERCSKDPKLDVTFLYNTRVKGATTSATSEKQQRVTQLQTNRGIVEVGDAQVLVAAGAWTPHICALMGLYAPVYPLKGYAMSISAKEVLSSTKLKAEDLPTRIVSDKYMYTSRLGDEIRITSIGEFSGWSTKPTPEGE